MEQLQELLHRLCSAPGVSGAEQAAVKAAEQELKQYGTISYDPLGNLVCHMGNPEAQRRILLDAHIDQIGMIVTSIDEKGFLRIAPCGGVDRRALPGTPVTVYGKEQLRGVVCCLPPHLVEGGEDKVLPVNQMAVDIGLSKEEAEKLVALGDRILWEAQPRPLLGERFTASGLDNRAGVCTLIRCAQLLEKESLDCSLTILLSSREEVGGQGAQTGAFAHNPEEAIIVDVSFASQPGVSEQKSGKLAAGPMIGIAPTLDRNITDELIRLAREKQIPFQYEVMGGKTGTNADSIGTARAGVRCGLASVPLRYMHTPVEVIDAVDIENTAKLIAAYIKEGKTWQM
ncbi:M42 family metallopeptidase [Clostridium minihomine]|uniref:M42 family metallopeptidase n=1 Tax=Clostridium minihomine TaxID=2045012 RepID=UPI000C77EEE3|nr:M42 family peptidase [Clostridium minihomine]